MMQVPSSLAPTPTVTNPASYGVPKPAPIHNLVTAAVSERGTAGVDWTPTLVTPRSSAAQADGHPCTGSVPVSKAANFKPLNPVHGWPSVRIFTMKGTPISTVIYMPVLPGKAPASPGSTDTVPAGMTPEIIHEDSPQMPQVPHPLDTEIEEMDQTRRDMVRLFAADGTICDRERAILDRFTNHYSDVAGYRLREVAADSFKRNGGSDLTGRRFVDAGFNLVDLDAHRKPANVVKFPTRQQAG